LIGYGCPTGRRCTIFFFGSYGFSTKSVRWTLPSPIFLLSVPSIPKNTLKKKVQTIFINMHLVATFLFIYFFLLCMLLAKVFSIVHTSFVRDTDLSPLYFFFQSKNGRSLLHSYTITNTLTTLGLCTCSKTKTNNHGCWIVRIKKINKYLFVIS